MVTNLQTGESNIDVNLNLEQTQTFGTAELFQLYEEYFGVISPRIAESLVEASNQSKSGHKVLKGATYWFTGLSGAGKSTLSEYVKKFLDQDLGDNKKVFILDGDVIRTGLNKDLGFSPEDRKENIRRIKQMNMLMQRLKDHPDWVPLLFDANVVLL